MRCVFCDERRPIRAVTLHGWHTWACIPCTLNKLHGWSRITEVTSLTEWRRPR